MVENFSALVALRAKKGEFDALDRLKRDPGTARHVQPLIELHRENKLTNQLEKTWAAGRVCAQLGRKLMVDAAAATGEPGFGAGAAGPLHALADRLYYPEDLLDELGAVGFLPVIRTTSTDDDVAALGRLCHELGSGGALRVDTTNVRRDVVERLLERAALDPRDVHLVLDLQYVLRARDQLVERAARDVDVLAGLGPFRTTSVLSGSVPEQFRDHGTWVDPPDPRPEEALWHALIRGGLCELRMADYGVVHPIPRTGIARFPQHITLKYASGGRWLYTRQRKPEREGDSESPDHLALRSACRGITGSGRFAGRDFSPGDRWIDDAADCRTSDSTKSSTAIAVATSHHLAYLASRAAS